MNGTARPEAARVSRRSGVRRAGRLAGALALAGGLVLVGGASSMATAAAGPSGQTLSVDRSEGLNAAGDSVVVSGAGYDLSKGIYVGICVNNGPGAVATPCLGGVDMSGGSGSSVWISSNPPSYGQGLAQPFTQSGGTGSFSVALGVVASDSMTNCQDPGQAPNGCVVVTRADHTRSADRSADVMVPISFGAVEAPAAEDAGEAGNASGGAAGNAAPGEATAAETRTGKSTDPLAKTGASTTVYVAAGAVLLAAGAGALVMTKRRRGGQ
ncbi:LPXTG-motif cell wall-anchored protein [Arthrobacter stackebrandtii]|uniref:LPXTG-motif cell wall-anchored protein n=1 Tax=Arthrobacter stackebrandtii TaxID=272161 RepID=A0ABS4YUV6_9MICC|nr:LPXTG cell wall anchor domain-containing protein [Arthrobacter stackebrandtii]MBP2412585.1 LPXTG-motif cell wall-anchored protein [Arthrobacter stackebrandtii]PYH02324.1 hypothetical protein CVV67_02565 [Arthrobacter stackebrandtii]